MSNEFICNMKKDVKNVQALKSNSASPTDTWLVNFNKKLTFIPTGYPGVRLPCNSAFIKMFINPKDIKSLLKPFVTSWVIDADALENKVHQAAGLFYELHFYRLITNPLVFSTVCPYFVTCYDTSLDCTFNQMTSLVDGKLNSTMFMSDEQLVRNMARNASFMLGLTKGKRPSLADNVKATRLADVSRAHYCCIMNESMKDIPTLDVWLKSKTQPEVFGVLFQVAIACYALFLSKAIHNDLHSGNIYVKEADPVVPVIYEVGDRIYKFIPKWVPYLYDFDRSYAVRMGDNEINDQYYCDGYSQCNDIGAGGNKDFIKCCCYIAHDFKSSAKNTPITTKIESAICKTARSSRTAFREVISDDMCWLRTADRISSFSNAWFTQNFKSITNIIPELFLLSNFASQTVDLSTVLEANVHSLRPSLFNDDGVVQKDLATQRKHDILHPPQVARRVGKRQSPLRQLGKTQSPLRTKRMGRRQSPLRQPDKQVLRAKRGGRTPTPPQDSQCTIQ